MRAGVSAVRVTAPKLLGMTPHHDSRGSSAESMDALRTTVADLGTIVSIWAHPDDETYLAAGIMAAARDNGQHVVCVAASAGEHGSNDPDAWPPLRLGAVRRWEAAAAMAVLGVEDHRIFGLPDGALPEHHAIGTSLVCQLLDEVRPDTILTFGRDGMTYHRDHIAIHRWVSDAWQHHGRRARLLYAATTVELLDQFRHRYEDWNLYMTDERPTGVRERDLDVHVRLHGCALDRKLTALRAMATQTGGLIGMLEPDTYAAFVADECFVDAAPRLDA
jgi:LmbE family N-acetylglucosaminyl deacetylase